MKFLNAIIFSIVFLGTSSSLFAEKPLDFDGDGKTDFAVTVNRDIGGGPFVRDWYIKQSGTNDIRHAQWGLLDDPTRPADYDGDGKTDITVIRFSSADGRWRFYILESSTATARVEAFGIQSDDLTPVGDYDGDGKADLIVYRRSTVGGGQHQFIYRGSLNNPAGALTYVPWGSGVVPFLHNGDFDGDGKFDFCIRSGSAFVLRRSSDLGIEYIPWGLNTDTYLRPGDYDGDGKTDFIALRNQGANFAWYVLERDGGGTGAAPIFWGATASDVPLSMGDYDGDGRADVGVYRFGATTGTFLVRKTADGSLLADGSLPQGGAIRLE